MYYFQNSGAGLTGELDGYLYYKGRRQTGSGTRAVYYSKNEDSNSADVIVEYLVDAEGKIHPEIRPSVEALITAPFVYPEDILEAIRSDGEAWQHFEAFSEPYKRIRVAYVDAARKRPAEFQKRLENFIRRTRENKLITGYGGIEKYYK